MPARGPHQIVDAVAIGTPIYPFALSIMAINARTSPESGVSAGAATNWTAWRLSFAWLEKSPSLTHCHDCFDVKVCTRSLPRHVVVPFTNAYHPILSGSESLWHQLRMQFWWRVYPYFRIDNWLTRSVFPTRVLAMTKFSNSQQHYSQSESTHQQP